MRMPNKFYNPRVFADSRGACQGGICMLSELRNRRDSAPMVCLKTFLNLICWFFLLLIGVGATMVPSSWAREPAIEASTSAQAKREAIQAIPFNRIDAKQRQLMKVVIEDCSLFRRLPTEIIDCDPRMYSFLALNPEVLVEIWRELGITRVNLERIDKDSFQFSDNAGTTGHLEIVEQECKAGAQNRIVMFAEGVYEGQPFTRPIGAQCVLLLRSGSVVETNGRTYVATKLDSFIRIDQASIELFAKVVQPLVGKTADRNFSDTLTFVGNFSKAAELEPERIERLALALPRVTPDRQQRLAEIANQAGKSAKPSPAGVRTASHTAKSAR